MLLFSKEVTKCYHRLQTYYRAENVFKHFYKSTQNMLLGSEPVDDFGLIPDYYRDIYDNRYKKPVRV